MAKYNILEDDIYSLIRKIAIPASVGSLFTTLYNVVDTIFAGQIGSHGEGLAGVSITFPLFLMILSISIGLGAGTSVLVGNAIGAKEDKKAREITYNSFILAMFLSILGVAILYPLLPSILRFLKVSPEVMPYSLSYIRVIYLGMFTFTLSGVANSVLSAQGQTKPYRNILILGFFLNIILDPVFLGQNPLYYLELVLNKILQHATFGNFGMGMHFSRTLDIFPNMGTAGIALATIVIQFFQTIYIIKKLKCSKLFKGVKVREEFRYSFETIKDILRQGVPAMLNMVTVTTGIFILNYFVSFIGGAHATAALGIGYRIEQIVMMPASGIYIAMMSIISQNKGAGNIDRVSETFKKGLISSVVLLTVGTIIIYTIKLGIILLFTSSVEITRLTVEYLSVEVFTIPAYAVLSTTSNTLQAIKKPKIPMYATLLRQFLLPLCLYTIVTFIFKLPIKFIWVSVFINNWCISIFLLYNVKRELHKLK